MSPRHRTGGENKDNKAQSGIYLFYLKHIGSHFTSTSFNDTSSQNKLYKEIQRTFVLHYYYIHLMPDLDLE